MVVMRKEAITATMGSSQALRYPGIQMDRISGGKGRSGLRD